MTKFKAGDRVRYVHELTLEGTVKSANNKFVDVEIDMPFFMESGVWHANKDWRLLKSAPTAKFVRQFREDMCELAGLMAEYMGELAQKEE